MKHAQNTRWTIPEMSQCIAGLTNYAFADTEYVSISRLYTGGSHGCLAGDALRTTGNWPHHTTCVCGATASRWKRCR